MRLFAPHLMTGLPVLYCSTLSLCRGGRSSTSRVTTTRTSSPQYNNAVCNLLHISSKALRMSVNFNTISFPWRFIFCIYAFHLSLSSHRSPLLLYPTRSNKVPPPLEPLAFCAYSIPYRRINKWQMLGGREENTEERRRETHAHHKRTSGCFYRPSKMRGSASALARKTKSENSIPVPGKMRGPGQSMPSSST